MKVIKHTSEGISMIVLKDPITIHINLFSARRAYGSYGIVVTLFHEVIHYILYKLFGLHKIHEVYDNLWFRALLFKEDHTFHSHEVEDLLKAYEKRRNDPSIF